MVKSSVYMYRNRGTVYSLLYRTEQFTFNIELLPPLSLRYSEGSNSTPARPPEDPTHRLPDFPLGLLVTSDGSPSLHHGSLLLEECGGQQCFRQGPLALQGI